MSPYFVLIAVFTALLAEVTSLDEDGCEVDHPYDPFHPCPRSYTPVCGTDSRTYANDCLFCQAKRAQMSRGLGQMGIHHHGKCDDLPRTTARPTTTRPTSRPLSLTRLMALFQYFEKVRRPWQRPQRTNWFPIFNRLRFRNSSG